MAQLHFIQRFGGARKYPALSVRLRAQTFARIRAYLSTVRKNKRDVFQETVNALTGRPFMPSAAS